MVGHHAIDRCVPVEIVRILLNVLLVMSSIFLVLLILMHKGRGGGMSDMFGGGMSSSLGGSSIAERNLNRITVAVSILWITSIVGIGVLIRFL